MSTSTPASPLQLGLHVLSWTLMILWFALLGAAFIPFPAAFFAPNPRPVPHFYPGQILADADGRVLADSTQRTIQVYGASGELEESRPLPAELRRSYDLAISREGTLFILGQQGLFAWQRDGWEQVATADHPMNEAWELGIDGVPVLAGDPSEPPPGPHPVAPGELLFHPELPSHVRFQDLDGSTLRNGWLGIVREGPDGEELARYAPPTWAGIINWRSALVLFPLFMLVLVSAKRSRRGRVPRAG